MVLDTLQSRTDIEFVREITNPPTGADPGLTVGGAKYTAREILCATPTFDVISANDMLYEEKVNK